MLCIYTHIYCDLAWLYCDYVVHIYTYQIQFGFKAKLGCSHAIYAARRVTDYYVYNNCTVNLCFLDMAKAFDKVNHCFAVKTNEEEYSENDD